MRVADGVWTGLSGVVVLVVTVTAYAAHHSGVQLDTQHGKRVSTLLAERDQLITRIQVLHEIQAVSANTALPSVLDAAQWQARFHRVVEAAAREHDEVVFTLEAAHVVSAPVSQLWALHTVPWTLEAESRHGLDALGLLDSVDIALDGVLVDACELSKTPSGVSVSCSGVKLALEHTE